MSIEATRAVEADEKADRGEAITEQDWINAEFVDKGAEVAPVIEDVPDEVTQPATALIPAPEKKPEQPADMPPAPDDPWLAELDAAAKAK